MRRRLIALMAATAIALLGGFVSPSAAQAAASPQCWHYSHLYNYTGWITEVPAVTSEGSTHCYMFRGMGLHNSAVMALQTTLNDCYLSRSGAPYPLLRVDGDFGGNTQRALKWAQGQSGAAPDGEYGPETRSKLNFTSHRGLGGCARVP